LPAPAKAGAELRCPACRIEVDAARLETLVGKPRFVAERSWTGADLGGLVVEEVIGAGGMGTVYRARAATGERLAVKFLSPSLAAEPEVVTRFQREVSLLEKLDHPAIVKLKAHGEQEGLPWFAMELVEGPTLAGRLGQGPLVMNEARAIFARLLAALAHAHERGVVHRDLKPANVLLAPDGARLADFGIARLDMAAATRKTQLTRTDAIIGTFSYMSPEQRAGRPVDARSDLYAVGVMLYEALSGERPEGAFPPLARRRPEVPGRVDEVVRRLLQPAPEARFASAADAGGALEKAFTKARLARRPVAWAAVAALAIAAAWAMLPTTQTRRMPPSPPSPPRPLPAQKVAAAPALQSKPVDQVVPPDLPLAEAKSLQGLDPQNIKSARAAKVPTKSMPKSKKAMKAGPPDQELFLEPKPSAGPPTPEIPLLKSPLRNAAPLDQRPANAASQNVAPPPDTKAAAKPKPSSAWRRGKKGTGKGAEGDLFDREQGKE
jgi:serine/threonine protein kinase